MAESESIVSFAYEAGHLKQVPRAGWLIAGVRDPESVAEHSFRVAVLAYVLAVQEGSDFPERAATLGLFHDLPETRIGDVPSVGKAYVRTEQPHEVVSDQVAGLPPRLAARIIALIDEHESAKEPDASIEARCSRDADKIDCLLQAREYQAQGNTNMQRYIDSMLQAVRTNTGQELAKAALEVPSSAWWDGFAARFGTPQATVRSA
ncbi:HD domain-containing protein (plasmid) [Saccharothrix sp. AJ9571]|nr:HD domain-containing protein [Saccharothrix sp. AJ9571]